MADYAKASANLLFVRKKISQKGINPELHQELAAAELALDAEYAKVKGYVRGGLLSGSLINKGSIT